MPEVDGASRGSVDTRGGGDSAKPRGDESSGDDPFHDAAEEASLLSGAPTDASGFPGDVSEKGAQLRGEMSFRPFSGGRYEDEMSDGIWEGEDADSAVAANGCPGTFGVFCGNWGENFTCQKAQEHMEFDLKSGPCNFVMLSEALPELLAHLREQPPKASPAGDRTEEPRGGGETKCELRPTYRYIGLRGLEPKSSLMIAARASLVKGMRLS